MGFLKTILIITLVYYAFRFIGRYILPIVLGAAVKKAQKNYQDQMNGTKPQRPVGEVTIENIPKKDTSKSEKGEGDYVDFEELEG